MFIVLAASILFVHGITTKFAAVVGKKISNLPAIPMKKGVKILHCLPPVYMSMAKGFQTEMDFKIWIESRYRARGGEMAS
jgi:hypothetical protein